MRLPNRHSLLWQLVGVLALLCMLVISLQADLSKRLKDATALLSEPAKQSHIAYAQQAETAWRERGTQGVDEFLHSLRKQERVWAAVVDEHQQSLSSQPLDEHERRKLDFVRPLHWTVGRPNGWPTFYVPFSDDKARLVMELPHRFNPREHLRVWEVLLQWVLPAGLALLLGFLLYRVLIAPVVTLRRQAAALSSGNLSARAGPQVARRRDELGDLGRTFDHMAERLENTLALQRRLMRDLSHELRTPLSRLRVTGEREPDMEAMRQRLEREVQSMDRLIGDTLELVWLDTERPALALEPVELDQLWEVLSGDASFESGWPIERLRCDLPPDCRVMGNLNSLAQALENILRNAIRHSPQHGAVTFTGVSKGAYWYVWIEDQGPGVAPDKLEQIFQPFTRLNAARPGGSGFGLGLSIARSVVQLQGGEIWAENTDSGLRINLKLQMYKM